MTYRTVLNRLWALSLAFTGIALLVLRLFGKG